MRSGTMADLSKAGIFLLVFCVPAIWSIYVVPPEEHSSNLLDTLEKKKVQMLPSNEYEQTKTYNSPPLGQQSVKYPLNEESYSPSFSSATATASATPVTDSSGNGQTNNAMLAKTSQLRHHTSYDKNDDVVVFVSVDDGVNGNNNNNNNEKKHASIFENSETQTSLTPQHTTTPHKEDEIDDANTHSISRRQRRELSDWLIAPNTRWCGRGNSANGTYNHLGGASRADKCCRKHDHCKLFIPAMSNRYGLFNYLPYTLSHCNCDIRFRTCLKMAGDEDADTIGRLYFNMVDTQCFVLVKEHVCQQRAADGTCAMEHVKKKGQLRKNKRF